MNRQLETGACVLQSYHGIANPDDPVVTRMLTVTYVIRYSGGATDEQAKMA